MNKGKLMFIIGAVLIALSILLSTVSVVMVSNALKKIAASENPEEEQPVRDIPLSQITQYDLTESIIVSLNYEEGSNRRLNVVLDIGFGFDSKNKQSSKDIALLTEKEAIIRDRILKLLQTKSANDFMPNNIMAIKKIQEEILILVSGELDSESIVEVYFSNVLRSER